LGNLAENCCIPTREFGFDLKLWHNLFTDFTFPFVGFEELHLKFGDFGVEILFEGTMKIDGGAVFGMVPRTIWERILPPDAKNKVKLGLRQILVKGKDFNLIVDAGIGDNLSSKLKAIYSVEINQNWETRLKPHGLTAQDITHLVFTHLHFDHAAGATCLNEDKTEVVPVFPNAEVFIQEGEWVEATVPNELTRGSYRYHDFIPLKESRNFRLITGDQEIIDGIKVKVTGGHTSFHQMVIISQGQKRIYIPGDLIPTSCHLNVAWHSAFDLFPIETLKARKSFLAKIINQDHLVFFGHDPEGGFKKITGTIEKPQVLDFNAS